MRHASRRFAETDIGLTTLAGSPRDQAHGLRRMFAASRQRLVPLVHNPFATFGGIGMERLCAAFAERGLHTLVVDAADTASTPQELAGIDLAACVQQLSRSVSFLAARGLPMRWLDSRGLTTGFLQALSEAAPRADVILVHAGASDLARMFAGRAPRPLLLAADSADSLTSAYASMKVLAQRLGVLAFDLLLAASGDDARLRSFADRLSDCADRFLGAALGEWAAVDPAEDAADTLAPSLRLLAAATLAGSDNGIELGRPMGWSAGAAALPSHAN